MGLFSGVKNIVKSVNPFASPDLPDAPNYAGAAQQEAAANEALARQQTTANRPNIYTPGGSQTWHQDPNDPDQWTGLAELSPEGQKAFDARQIGTAGLAQVGARSIGQLGGGLASPYQLPGGDTPTYQGPGRAGRNYNSMPGLQMGLGAMPQYQGPKGAMPQYQGPEGQLGAYGEHRQGVMDAMMARTDTDIGRDRERQKSQLIAQGIPVGSEAFNREMEMLDRKQTDARQQAEIAAEGMAGMGYASDIAGRQQMGAEGLASFGAGMEGRRLAGTEGMADYQTGMQSRGVQHGENKDQYEARMKARGMTNQEINDEWDRNLMGSAQQYDADRSKYQQQISDSLLQRNQPIDEAMSLYGGLQMPQAQMGPYGQQQFTQGPNLFGAAQQQGQFDIGTSNQDIGQKNALMSGLFGLGTAAIPGLF